MPAIQHRPIQRRPIRRRPAAPLATNPERMARRRAGGAARAPRCWSTGLRTTASRGRHEMTGGSQAVVAALQGALAAENSAIYGYGVAGAHLTGAHRAAAVRNWVSHENARDALTAMLASRGAQPVAAAAVY